MPDHHRAAHPVPADILTLHARKARPPGQGTGTEVAQWKEMSKTHSRRFPVTVTHLPVTRCQVCHRTIAYRPGTLSQTLTEHYRRAHPEALSLPCR